MIRRVLFAVLVLLLPSLASAQIVSQGPGNPNAPPWNVVNPMLGEATATWTSATADETTLTVNLPFANAGSAVIWMNPVGTVTGGRLIFEMLGNAVSSTWEGLSGSNGDRAQAYVDLGGTTVYDGLEAGWRFPMQGARGLRVRLETPITGAGSVEVTITVTAAPTNPFGIARQGEWDRLLATVGPYGNSQTTTVTGTNSTAAFDISRAMGNPYLRLFQSGTQWTGAIAFFQSANGTNWETLPCLNATFTGELAVAATGNSSWFCFATSGMRYVRVTGATVTNTAGVEWYTGSSTAQITYGVTMGSKTLGAVATATNPVLIGGYAQPLGSNPTVTAVDTSFDASKALTNVLGMPFVAPMSPNPITREYDFTAAGGARTDFQVSETIAAGTRAVVTRYSVTASNANSVDVACRMGFGTSTLPAVSATAGTGAVGIFMSHPAIAAGSGVVETQVYALGGDGEEVRATCASPTGGAMRLSITYYLVP